jgi:nucleoside 2-deoxyribosyltransferase
MAMSHYLQRERLLTYLHFAWYKAWHVVTEKQSPNVSTKTCVVGEGDSMAASNGAKPIARWVAQNELTRIDQLLTQSKLLVGGLAVAQYVTTRNSKDIDLLIAFDEINAILAKLYPTREWSIENKTRDEYRPSFEIRNKHNSSEGGSIHIGPKIEERAQYRFVDWAEMKQFSSACRVLDTTLKHIVVPSAARLAFSKVASFVSRIDVSREKAVQDLVDAVNLTNVNEFSANDFFGCFQRCGEGDELETLFRQIVARDQEFLDIVAGSCLCDLGRMFCFDKTPAILGNSAPPLSRSAVEVKVYLAAPHQRAADNARVANPLLATGATVLVPADVVRNRRIEEAWENAAQIKDACVSSIDSSDLVLVDLDNYGLDTAWEVGYAEGRNKSVVGLSQIAEDNGETRMVRRRPYLDNFMHGWQSEERSICKTVQELLPIVQAKSVYVCGSFKNTKIGTGQWSDVQRVAKRLILPKEILAEKYCNQLPKDYPLFARAETNRLLELADIVLVVLPRYGMDVAWQIGYAEAKKKVVVGLLLDDDGRSVAEQSFWDHWMHAWKHKTVFRSLQSVTAYVRGLVP